MLGSIRHVLFVCTGNICRSPFAEGICKKLVDDMGLVDIHVDSAGVMALPGNHATSMAQKVAREHDVDLENHRAQLVTEELVAWSDLILVMEKAHESELLHSFGHGQGKVLLLRYFARSGSRNRGIADPYGLNYEAYRFCFLDIEESASGLVAYLEGTTEVFRPVQVTCYEGYKANESPRFFTLDERRYAIIEIVDRWYDSEAGDRNLIMDYYKVQTEEGDIYLLRYNRDGNTWGVKVC